MDATPKGQYIDQKDRDSDAQPVSATRQTAPGPFPLNCCRPSVLVIELLRIFRQLGRERNIHTIYVPYGKLFSAGHDIFNDPSNRQIRNISMEAIRS